MVTAQSNEHLARAERELIAVDPTDKTRVGANCNVAPVCRTAGNNPRPQQPHRKVAGEMAGAGRTIVASAASNGRRRPEPLSEECRRVHC